MKEVIDEIISEIYTPPENTSLIVGVTKNGQSSIFGYGEKQGPNSGTPKGDTLFEIGSITKVFTTSLLSHFIAMGELNLETPICEIFSILSDLPPEITLLRLATHTSGLPNMPPNTSWKALLKRRNPYVDYTIDNLIEYLSKYKKKPRPDETINYSNMGIALLGLIIAEKTGGTYEKALVDIICQELGMPDTRITLTSEQEERIATPHSGGGKSSNRWDLTAFAGAGALYSTVDDILRFLHAHMGRPTSSLTEALQLTQVKRANKFPSPSSLMKFFPGASQRRKKASYFTQSIGLGWMIGTVGEVGPEAHWHHGATGGYIAFTGFVRKEDIGTVILVNRSLRITEMISEVSSVDEIGFRVLESMYSND